MGVTEYPNVERRSRELSWVHGESLVSMPRASDSGDPENTPRITVRRMLPSATGMASASRSDQFRSSSLTAYSLAVYASHPPVTRRMATLAAGLPATALTGLDLHQLDSCKEFHCLITDPPFPRLSQREPVFADWRYRALQHDDMLSCPATGGEQGCQRNRYGRSFVQLLRRRE